MAVQVEVVTRKFTYNNMPLEAPDDSMTPEQVKEFYAASYQELATAEVIDLGVKDDVHHFEFRRAVGSKGAE